ncbi:hypothetical protein AB2B38_003430 [Balneola sp. MJW-20]|uniref:hypothetical protein n=1 Tax=Gracilimonas aurantiaca TaxID=3234185 RepID=UPI0034677F5E
MQRNLFLLSALIILFAGCTRNDDQRAFEQQAYQPASGITQTNALGEVLSTDEDDWRTSPLFEGLINISPPFPNPARTNQAITFEIDVTGVQAVSGLEMIVWFSSNRFATIYFDNQSPLPPGLTTFQINPIELSEFGTIETARGTHRVILFDGNQQMISYGDIRVE